MTQKAFEAQAEYVESVIKSLEEEGIKLTETIGKTIVSELGKAWKAGNEFKNDKK